MPTLLSLPDEMRVDFEPGETVLDVLRSHGIHIACACGGKAKCSTCRIWVLEGAADCPERNALERAMAERLRLSANVRLACQLRPTADLTFRRLVLDETDLRMANQLLRHGAMGAGEMRSVVLFFSDVSGFTSFSEALTPYDLMYLLNRYFAQAGEIVERNDGYIDKFVGDGMMAIFGVKGQEDAALRSVNASLQTLAAVDRLKPFYATMYGIEFDIRIGLHLGDAVIGSVGSPGSERLTAIGDAVNIASRIENANKEAGTRLLISEPLYEAVKEDVEIADFIRVRLRGTLDRITLYEVRKLKDEAERRLNETVEREAMRLDGKTWRKAMRTNELAVGEHKVVEFPEFYVAILRDSEHLYAFNNACPHLKLPFFEQNPSTSGLAPPESHVDDKGVLLCRWHHSGFDLATGEIVHWCESLSAEGVSEGMEKLGDISKNRSPLNLLPCREEDGYIWVGID
ncbi:2Fe-2S iron-sulfur cluster binding domain-containing protein [Stappia sp. F7233]|uniref:2Fe-2S iron-sulfur cluster binding domain-containing protein n=1 Tax=Stappia albiluteola TaxID=2758565 RepID=A0A839ABU2_9HYPH|nr:adenylate/guanylate cyclase domain-containing protein [Stappia albiluteola]MBA5776464.1 2Fe-2S iron-sulfur cluster binding domain-containing protein [Stappia albiluteola]